MYTGNIRRGYKKYTRVVDFDPPTYQPTNTYIHVYTRERSYIASIQYFIGSSVCAYNYYYIYIRRFYVQRTVDE